MTKYQPIFDQYNAKLTPLLMNTNNVEVLSVSPYAGTGDINTLVEVRVDRAINAQGEVNPETDPENRYYTRTVEMQRFDLASAIMPDVKAALDAALEALGTPTLVHGKLSDADRNTVITNADVRELIMLLPEDVDFTPVGTGDEKLYVMTAKKNSLSYIGRVDVVVEPEVDGGLGNLEGLAWITSDTQVVAGSLTFPDGVTVGQVGTAVKFQYTNTNTERLRAKIGFHIGGVYSTKDVAVEPGGGEWTFEMPARADYPHGEFPIEFKYGIDDIVNGAWIFGMSMFKMNDLEWLKASDNVVVHGVIHPNYYTPVHAAKYGETITVKLESDITDHVRARLQVAGIGEPVEVDLYPGPNHTVEFTLPTHVEMGDASMTILLLGEGESPLGFIHEFKIMNADVDESLLEFGDYQDFFNSGLGGTTFYPAEAILDWMTVRLARADGSPLESGTANDPFPRTMVLVEESPEAILDIRVSENGAPNNYSFDVRLKDGVALTEHKELVMNFNVNKFGENASNHPFAGTAYVFPESMSAQVQQPNGTWVNFADWDTAITLTNETELDIRLGAVPESWTSKNPTTYELVSATGEPNITVDWENGRILFGSPTVVSGNENVIEIVVKVSPDGIGSFNEFNATLNVRRTT